MATKGKSRVWVFGAGLAIVALLMFWRVSPLLAQHETQTSTQQTSEAHHTDEASQHQESHANSGHGHDEHAHCVDLSKDKVSDHVIHHIADSHDWIIFEYQSGTCSSNPSHVIFEHFGLSLPWIVYDSEKGIRFFGSTESLSHEENYLVSHDKIHLVQSKTPVEVSPEEAEKNAAQYVVIEHGDHKQVYQKKEGSVMDFSITKTSLHILLVFIVLTFVMLAVAKGYRRNEGKAPKGIQSFFEPIILFVRDEIGKTYLGNHYARFMPYLLTVFFFIWFSNLLGLTPFNSNIAGNIYVTGALALVTFIYILINSSKDFWMHILWFPGVPVPLKFLMLIVELMGVITKPVALAIRLFANIAAGHFMVLSLVGLIFILGKNGVSPGGGWGVSPLSIAFSLFIFTLEMLVALIQAFVFTLLSAVFISQAMETHSHDHGHEHDHGHAAPAHH